MKVPRRNLAVISFLVLGLGLVSSALEAPLATPESRGDPSLPAIIFVAAPTVVRGDLAGRFPKGSHLERFLPGNPPQSAINLTPEFFAVADPQISFDGKQVLYCGQKARGARWQIWEMKADGSGKHQITDCPGDCFKPAYLPKNQIVFTVATRKGPQWRSAIYVSEENGARVHPITFGPGNFQVETVLQSGRILVSADSSLVAGGKDDDSRVFYTLRPDGTGLNLFRWENRPNVVRTGAEELADGTVLFVERADPDGVATGGELAWIQPGHLRSSVITPRNSVYESARVLDGNQLVVSKEDSSPSKMRGKFCLYTFSLATKSIGKPIYSNPKFSSVQAVAMESRPIPMYYWSILHPKWDYGRVVCLNSYLSQGAPHGRLTTSIARVRVIALQPDHRKERVLGEAPVESDGSFYIKVPANHPIRFELLSAKGTVIRAQKSWIWARNGEDLACLGCHENKAIVPTNHFPLALKSFDTPTPVGVPSHPQAQEH